MRFIIYGAGGIGGTIGARLFQSGHDVVLIARGEHGRILQDRGLRLLAPDGDYRLPVPTVLHPREAGISSGDLVLLAMKSQHTVAALEDLRNCAPADVGVVCAQNGVANERMALRRFRRVYGMLVHLPAQHLEPGEVVTYGAGRGGILDTGCYPHGTDDACRALTTALSEAGFSAKPDERVMRLKYAKLLTNLINALQAATDMNEGSREIARLLRHEALACFAAAGIDCATTEEFNARQEGVYRMADVPGRPRGGGSSWQSLMRGTGNIEADYLNGEIVLLGRLHGVATPANAVCQDVARRMAADRLAPGSFDAAALLAQIEAARRLGA